MPLLQKEKESLLTPLPRTGGEKIREKDETTRTRKGRASPEEEKGSIHHLFKKKKGGTLSGEKGRERERRALRTVYY